MYAHLEGEVTPLAETAPDTPAWLVEVVSRALARAPEARFQSAGAFRDALDAHLPHRTPAPVTGPLAVMTREAPTLVPETVAAVAIPTMAAPTPPAAGRLARLRTWMFPRLTWEYSAGPDGLLTVRRALRPRSGAHPQPAPASPPAAAHGAPPFTRAWAVRVALVALAGALGVVVASRLWQDDRPSHAPATATAQAAPPIAAPSSATPPTVAPPTSVTTPAAPPIQPPRTPVEDDARREARRLVTGATTSARTSTTNATLPPPDAPAEAAPLPPPTPPAALPPPEPPPTPTPMRFTPPVGLKDEVLEDAVLLVPGSRGYDEVEVTLTFERERLVVFDTDEERVVATVSFEPGDGPSITGPATWLTGREYWFIVPTTAGRIVVQLEYRAVSRAAAAFEARTGRPVRRAQGELDR
jgi:hypothetical protein